MIMISQKKEGGDALCEKRHDTVMTIKKKIRLLRNSGRVDSAEIRAYLIQPR
jgi:hypothetical protein